MKRLGAILLIGLIFLPLILKLGVVVSWVMQHDYIVANLCEEKDKVVNTCSGKCYLNKNIQKIEDSSTQKHSDAKINFNKLEYSPFIANDNVELQAIIINENCIPYTFFKDGESQFSPHLDIPPPKVC